MTTPDSPLPPVTPEDRQALLLYNSKDEYEPLYRELALTLAHRLAAQVDALEQELAAANKKIGELEEALEDAFWDA